MTVKNLRGYIRTLDRGRGREEGERGGAAAVLVRKRVAQRWFLRWYWDAFDSDIQSALANILGSTESAMEDAFSLSPDVPPSAIRGVRLCRATAATCSATTPRTHHTSGATSPTGREVEHYSDSPLSDDSPDAMGAAAERLFARGQRISVGKDKDVRMARRCSGAADGARARRDAGLVPADEDSSGDEEDEERSRRVGW